MQRSTLSSRPWTSDAPADRPNDVATAISRTDSTVTESSDSQMRSKPDPGPPGLYVVATPIGNLRDITLRALDVLTGADVIACEDTRVTGRLLKAHGIATPMLAYHEHNAGRARPGILRRLAAGERVALVADAGTPLISDPGYRLVGACVEAGIAVVPVPGPSAALAALVASGLPTDRFQFAGFLPSRGSARRRALAALAALGGFSGTILFYESTRRLGASLADMAAALGPRPAAVARELTKLHEEIRRGTLDELAAHYAAAGPPKGEAVIVVGPAGEESAPAVDEQALDARLRQALAHMSVREAAGTVAAETGLRRKLVYGRALVLSGRRREDGE